MRILFDATPLQTGHRQRGVGTYTRELLRCLLALDRENHYLLIAHAVDENQDPLLTRLPANASLIRLARPRLGRLTAFASHQLVLPGLLARWQADLFHAPGFVAAFSVPGLPWRWSQPLVTTLHDFIPLHVPELFNDKAINRWWYGRQMALARRAALLICVSQATQRDALHFLGLPAERCVVIPEGVDSRVFRPDGRQELTPPFILFVGGDFPNKNRSAALAAFSRLQQDTALPHRLVMVGPDAASSAELARRYAGLDVSRLQRIPRAAQAELAQLYRDAAVLLFPSTCEGFGLPVLEAMASGTPVITSTASSLPEVAGKAALLVDPHDVDAIAAALRRVLSDPALRAELRRAGLARAAQFTWEAMAQRTLQAYRAVVDR